MNHTGTENGIPAPRAGPRALDAGAGPPAIAGRAPVGYISAMGAALPILLAILLGAVLIVILFGVLTMAVGGDFNRRYGNKLMRLRVLLQLAAVALFVVLILATRGGG